ncbi:hypothetical protein DXG01_001800 [Tephrocybe rancida]|nr:hypothetical protein DXG01_001800 [Tephrocybe rancida]
MALPSEPLWSETPLIRSGKLSKSLDASVYLKLETFQPTQSFKYRGISLFVQRAREAHGPNIHLVIASSGNAGLATAYIAKVLQLKCSVYLPEGATPSTIEVLREMDAEVVVGGRVYVEALQAVKAAAEQDPNMVMVPSYDHEIIWEGHSSLVREISTQLPTKPDAIFCSVGGGGLIGGIITGCKQVGWDDVPIIALETIGSNCFFHSIALNGSGYNSSITKILPPNVEAVYDAENDVTLAHFNKFTSKASGSLGASEPSVKVLKMALERAGGVRCASVPDEMSMQALTSFADDHKVLIELAGSTTLTPACNKSLFDKLVPNKTTEKRTVVFVLCGGFKISLDEALEFRKMAEEDVAKGGSWGVLLDDGTTLSVEKHA